MSKKKDDDKNDVIKKTPIRPLRFMDSTEHLPTKNRIRKVYTDKWKPVLSLMYNTTKHLIKNVTEEV